MFLQHVSLWLGRICWDQGLVARSARLQLL